MFPGRFTRSRYLRAARTAHLARLAAVGAIAILPSACGNGDADAFDSQADASSNETAQRVDSTNATDPAIAPAETTEVTSTNPFAAAGSESFPAGAELVVDFTFSASLSGRVNNPYVAVWVEDADGNLVQTISLWYEQSGKGSKWLNDLRAWYSASGGGVDSTMSGATRSAGSYSVVWDGTDLDGNLVAAGEYAIFVEAAREHGPYEITSTAIAVDGNAFAVALADNGELTNLTATLNL